MSKHCSPLLALSLLAIILIGGERLIADERRASILILSDGAFTQPGLRINGRPVRRSDALLYGPWRTYAWADLDIPTGEVRIQISWTGADRRGRSIEAQLTRGMDSAPPQCAYMIRLDAVGDLAPASVGQGGDALVESWHHGG